MPRKKQQRFKEVHASPFVIEEGLNDVKKELQDFLKGSESAILELACGRGEYGVELAERNPKSKYIGIDIQGERLWFGMQEIKKRKLQNLKFARVYIDHLEQYFKKKSIDEIWITFPDPQPNKPKAKKRLTHPRFLEMYNQLLKNNGFVHLKTDNKKLFKWSIEQFKSEGWGLEVVSPDIDTDATSLKKEVTEIQTQFERKHRKLGDTIQYLRARKPIDN